MEVLAQLLGPCYSDSRELNLFAYRGPTNAYAAYLGLFSVRWERRPVQLPRFEAAAMRDACSRVPQEKTRIRELSKLWAGQMEWEYVVIVSYIGEDTDMLRSLGPSINRQPAAHRYSSDTSRAQSAWSLAQGVPHDASPQYHDDKPGARRR